MSITIRPFEPQDRQAIISLWAEAFPDDPPWNAPAAMLRAKEDFQPGGLLVGVNETAVVAVVMAGYDGHRGWINALAVAAPCRGRGYGKAMLQAAVALLEGQGAVKVNLQIRGDNTRLEGFYQSCGFTTENRISMGILTTRGAADHA